MIQTSAKQDIARLKLDTKQIKKINSLFKDAIKARKNSYSPYSKFAVGAAVTTDKSRDKSYLGNNIENSSFGATVCGERVAIWKAISENPKAKIDIIVLVTDTHPAASPCGICRQVLQEFSSANTILCQSSLKGVERIFTIEDLLPGAFDGRYLEKT